MTRPIRMIYDSDEEIGNGLVDIARNLVYGRKSYPPDVRTFLDKYGDQTISRIDVLRHPVNGLISDTLNFLSSGQFGDNLKNADVDKLFHLGLEIKTKEGISFFIEKESVVRIKKNYQIIDKDEFMAVNLRRDIKVIDFVENGRKKVGDDKFFIYSSKDSNCQDFTQALLKGNGLSTPLLTAFIKQDAEALFKNTGWLRKFTNTVTDIFARTDVIRQGGTIRKPNKWVLFIKEWAKANEVSYGCALSNPRLSSDYKTGKITTESEKEKDKPFKLMKGRKKKPSSVLL